MRRGKDDPNGPGKRTEAIFDAIREHGEVSAEQLAESLKVSVITIRRDLGALAVRGLLKRTHGGAVAFEPLIYEAFPRDSSFQEQIHQQAEEKRRIGHAAAKLIGHEEVIALSPGTTTVHVARSIPLGRRVTVLTNTLNIAMELCRRSDLTIFVIGGQLRSGWFSLLGPMATQSMRQMVVDKLFLGVKGVDPVRGATTYHPEEASLLNVMAQQAHQIIVVADHTKLGVVANYVITEPRRIDLLVTDSSAPPQKVAAFRKKSIAVLLA